MALIRGKTFSKPLLLKDYLRDDLSSCSSNGFKSFPRRQCCTTTTVRFLLEVDLKPKKIDYSNPNTKNKKQIKQILQRSRSKAASSTKSAIHRASEAVLKAVKQLPFPSAVKSQTSSTTAAAAKKGLLRRSFSRKLLKKNFWRKTDKEDHQTIKRWKSFRDFLDEQFQPSDQNVTCSSSASTSNSNSWSDFGTDILQSSSSGNSNSESSSDQNDVVESEKNTENNLVSNRVGVSVGGEDSSQENTKEWPIEEEKEQFSPVSVLDCPFEEDDDEKDISSSFQHRLACIKGTKKKLMQNMRRFDSLSQLEPVDLRKRIELSELEDESLEATPVQSCSMFDEDEEEEKESKVKAEELLKLIKSSTPSYKLKADHDNLLSGFFRERIAKMGSKEFDERELLKVAQDWINGEPQELFQGWEVKTGREAYVRDMEKNEMWRNIIDVGKEEVVLGLEQEVFTSLVNELVVDLLLVIS